MKRWLVEHRFTNWLLAKPWPHRGGWRYRTLYRMQREGFPPNRELTEAERSAIQSIMRRGTMGKWYRAPAGRLRSAWRAVTFPHVHGDWELDEALEDVRAA